MMILVSQKLCAKLSFCFCVGKISFGLVAHVRLLPRVPIWVMLWLSAGQSGCRWHLSSDVDLKGFKRGTANRTSRITCKKELWVPSARIGGATPVGSRLAGIFKGLGGYFGAR